VFDHHPGGLLLELSGSPPAPGALAGDPAIQGIISEELSVIRQRMLDAIGFQGHQRTAS
jgi:hypothetical protein